MTEITWIIQTNMGAVTIMPEIGAKVQLVCGQCRKPRELSVSPCPLCGNAATFQFKDE